MHAYVRAENKPMLHVFDRHHFVRLPAETPREVHLELDLSTYYKEERLSELMDSANVA